MEVGQVPNVPPVGVEVGGISCLGGDEYGSARTPEACLEERSQRLDSHAQEVVVAVGTSCLRCDTFGNARTTDALLKKRSQRPAPQAAQAFQTSSVHQPVL